MKKATPSRPAVPARTGGHRGAGWRGLALAAVVGAVPPAARAQAPGPNALADDATLIALAVSLACADSPRAEAPSAIGPAPVEASGPELELSAQPAPVAPSATAAAPTLPR